MVKPILEEDNEMEVDVIDESVKPNEDEIESTELKSSNMSPSFSNAPVTSLTKGLFLPDKDVMEYNPFLLNQNDEIAENVMMYLNGMETRLFDAHLQVKVNMILELHFFKKAQITGHFILIIFIV